ASTISAGYVDAARICAIRASGYNAIGATSCCSSCGVCCTGVVGAGAGSLDWPVGAKDSACAVNRTSKQQRSRLKICFDNFMTYSPVQKSDHFLGVRLMLKYFREPSPTAARKLLAT